MSNNGRDDGTDSGGDRGRDSGRDGGGSAEDRGEPGASPVVPAQAAYDDAAFARLRASDPAADAVVDAASVRAAVTRRVSAPVGSTRSAPRTSRWMQVAASVAALAVVGTVGFSIGSSGRADTTAGAAVGGDLGSSSAATPDAAAAATPQKGAVAPSPGSPEIGPDVAGVGPVTGPAGASTGRDSMFAGGGRNHFNDGGLATAAGSAEAFGYDPGSVVSADRAVSLGAALGLSGEPVANFGGWTVGQVDNSAPSLTLMGDGVASVSFFDPTVLQPGSCDGGKGTPEGAGPDQQSCASNSTEPAATEAEAVTRSTELLGAMGQVPGEYDIEFYSAGDSYSSTSAYRLLDNRRTGQAWSFTFIGTRLSSFYGQLAPIVSLGQYAVISPAAALQRLNDPRFAGFGGVYALDTVGSANGVSGTATGATGIESPSPVSEPTVPPVPVAGAPISWPVAEVSITGATLGLGQQWQPNGSVLLVPTFTMTADDGSSWSVIAVADDSLDFAH